MNKAHSIVIKLNLPATLLAPMLAAVANTGIAATQVADATTIAAGSIQQTQHKSVKVNDVEIFYREAGPSNAPTIPLTFS